MFFHVHLPLFEYLKVVRLIIVNIKLIFAFSFSGLGTGLRENPAFGKWSDASYNGRFSINPDSRNIRYFYPPASLLLRDMIQHLPGVPEWRLVPAGTGYTLPFRSEGARNRTTGQFVLRNTGEPVLEKPSARTRRLNRVSRDRNDMFIIPCSTLFI